MLNILLNQLQSIIPVKAISEIGSVLNVEYYEDNLPSESDIDEINTILDNWPLQKLKIKKIEVLDNLWKNKLTIGWQTPAGYRLGVDISDVALLNGAFTLAKEASNIGLTDPINIVDLDGQSHSMSLQDLTILMLQYGQARSSLSNSYANLKNLINSASSEQDLEDINLVL